MRVVVIGYGSIGIRHVKNLLKFKYVEIILLRTKKKGNEYNLKEIETDDELIECNPNYAVICTPTFKHFHYLKLLMVNNINILCEKPIVHKKVDYQVLKKLLNKYTGKLRIAYNLRYHPAVIKTFEILNSNFIGKIFSAKFFVGQNLKKWRPTQNHLENYSAHKNLGGGVVYDLIHEIDLAEYLVGGPSKNIYSISEKVSDYTVDSIDVSEIIYKSTSSSIVNIHLDYLYNGSSRKFLLIGENGNLHCDLLKNSIVISKDSIIIKEFYFQKFERNDMYFNLIKDYNNFVKDSNEKINIPTLLQNHNVMNTCFQILDQ